MAEVAISAIYPTSGSTIPTNGTDSNGIIYTAWELGDSVSFSLNVPADYVDGTDVSVNLQDASVSTSKNHKWSVTVIHNGSASATTTLQATSSSTSAAISSNSITIAALGVIGAATCAPGDLLSISLSRVAATSNEDSANIRLYAITVAYTPDIVTILGSNRLNTVVLQVLSKFNDDGQHAVTSSKVLDWINECQQEIASYGYWRQSASINVVGAQASYSLLTLFSTLNQLETVIWEDTHTKLTPIQTYDFYYQIKNEDTTTTTPYGYYLESNTLYIVPVPSASTTAGLTVYYSYCPSALNFTTNYTFSTPQGFDSIYQYYALMCAYTRDRHAPMAQDMFRFNQAAYQRQLGRLLGQNLQPGFSLRGYR